MYHEFMKCADTFSTDGLTGNQTLSHRQCWCQTLPADFQSQLFHLCLSYIAMMQRPLTHNMYYCSPLKTPIHSLLGETQNSLSLEFNMYYTSNNHYIIFNGINSFFLLKPLDFQHWNKFSLPWFRHNWYMYLILNGVVCVFPYVES